MTTRRLKVYLVSILIKLALFAVANYLSFTSTGVVFCDDCRVLLGVPFPLWEEGGFVTVRRIIWGGLIADAYLAVSVGLLLGWVITRFSSRRASA